MSCYIIFKAAGSAQLLLKDSLEIIRRWFWRNFPYFLAVSVIFPVFVYTKIQTVYQILKNELWRLWKVPIDIKQYLLIYKCHMSKECIQWHTKLEVKYCALQERIIKMKTSSTSGICPRNQDNKEKKKKKKQHRDRVRKEWVRENDKAGPSCSTAPGKIVLAALAHAHSYVCRPTGRLWIIHCRNMPSNSASLSTAQRGLAEQWYK